MLTAGSNGLMGSEAGEFLDDLAWIILGFDNDMRADLFVLDGGTTRNLRRLQSTCKNFRSYPVDIRNRDEVLKFFDQHRFGLIVHAAPSAQSLLMDDARIE
jgi:CDP-paratose 2-epimerase